MPLLQVSNLHAAYGAAEVLHGLSFDVEEGEIAALLGPNGAGKTTTLRALTALCDIRGESSVVFDGQELVGLETEKIVELGIAHVPEGRGVFPALSVEENLRLGGYLIEKKPGVYKQNLERVYEWFPKLLDRRSQLAGTLSGGEQQMLAIGRGLMSSPRMLLIDEASLGLAPIIVKGLFDIIRQINSEGMTVLMVEQNAMFTLAVASRAFLVSKGQIELSGTSAELREGGIVQAYLGEGSIGS